MTDTWIDAMKTTAEQKYARAEGVSDDTGAVMYDLVYLNSLSSYEVWIVCKALQEATASPEALSGMVNEIVEAWEI